MAVAALGIVSLTSCEDEPDKFEPTDGVPSVKYVRCLSTEVEGSNDPEDMDYTNGELVISASPGSTICLVGENLRSVYEVWFNDLKASLNQSLVTDNTLITTIPANVPGLVTDKIYMVTTSKDTVAYDFKVIISAPIINAMGNEYAAAGEVQTLRGNYFINDPGTPLTASFVGAGGAVIPAEIVNIAEDYKSIDIVIPEGAEEGPITVTSVYGVSKSGFYYKDSRGMLFDFDTPNEVTGTVLDNHGWNGHASETDDTAISGKFLRLGNGTAAMPADGSAWDEQNFSFVYWPGDAWGTVEDYATNPRLIDLVNFTDWKNMSLKFEINVPAEYPWMSGSLQICFAGTDLVTGAGAGSDIYGVTIPGANNAYFTATSTPRGLYRPWTDGGSFDTGGKWMTVSLPLTAFSYDADGNACPVEMTKDSFSSLWLFLTKGGIVGVDCTPVIKIDNIRVVPNN